MPRCFKLTVAEQIIEVGRPPTLFTLRWLMRMMQAVLTFEESEVLFDAYVRLNKISSCAAVAFGRCVCNESTYCMSGSVK